jgi:acetyl esterase/lipase
MMGLTRAVGLQVGLLILGTFFRRFFTHNGKGKEGESEDEGMTELRKSELLYDQTFTLVKAFMKAVSLHTVEEVQSFANAHTPATPWVYMLKTLVPKSCCDDAAVILIKVLGGRESTKRIVGGTRWWQVRGIDGVDAQWLAAKKDLREARKRYEKAKSTPVPGSEAVEEPACYEKDMDAMPCILYLHGGGYYFGSVDVERYSIQRHARKISGRVFAVNYRLAPQYPFPCALQDALASYLYLIRPPSGAEHQPVNPAHLIIAGDSAGGGLSIALLQVLRDASLPMPAGGVLISPWCDLTHSFPSIHTNSATDIMPEYGLSMQKPSSLWPPPAEEVTRGFHTSIRDRIRRIIPSEALGYTTEVTPNSRKITEMQKKLLSTAQSSAAADVGETTSAPESESTDLHDQTFTLTTGNEVLKIESQVQLYAPNNLIVHPLISPVLGYLGGLPPLLVIAGDSEVLRDECIYLSVVVSLSRFLPISTVLFAQRSSGRSSGEIPHTREVKKIIS